MQSTPCCLWNRIARSPGSEDGVIPWTYAHFADPYIALAQASGVTSKIKLGTGITLIPERNPLVLAKAVSTLDLFSGGRFILGIGTGWHREETTIMGGDFDHRWTQTKGVAAGAQGAVDEGRGRVPRQLLRLPSGTDVPQTCPKAASADT